MAADPNIVTGELMPGLIVAVYGTTGGEGPPETISFDIQFYNANGSGILAGVKNGWRLHDDVIDTVSVNVYPLKVGTPIIVWRVGEQVYVLFPERMALRKCPST